MALQSQIHRFGGHVFIALYDEERQRICFPYRIRAGGRSAPVVVGDNAEIRHDVFVVGELDAVSALVEQRDVDDVGSTRPADGDHRRRP